MEIKIYQGQAQFELVDSTAKVYSSHEFETSGELACEIPLDIPIGPQVIQLVPKLTVPPKCQAFRIDDRDYRAMIDARARDIGYDIKALGPLYPP